MRLATLLLTIALIPALVNTARAAISPTPAVDASLSENFTVSTRTVVPGKDLAPGAYKIAIIEHLSDRVILQITNKSGKVVSTFLGIIAGAPSAATATGPISWSSKGAPALRGFSFPGAAPIEFVYPKSQAVNIAKGNDDKVLAIDPASDNLSTSKGALSNQDMQIVTLWSLSATRVGPDAAPAIEAVRYQVPPQAPVYVARSTPPSAPAAKPAPDVRRSASTLKSTASAPAASSVPAAKTSARARTEIPSAGPLSAPEQAQVAAPVSRKQRIAVLPHTASELPLLLLGAVLALCGAAVLRIRRIYAA